MAGQRKSQGDEAPEVSDEQRGSPEMDVALISGVTFTHKAVTYYNVNGVAIVEGDIALGTVEEVRAQTEAARVIVESSAGAADVAGGGQVAFGVGITGSQFRWPNCVIPYDIDPALPNQQRVTDAIAHWEANTPFRFPLRTPATASQYPNYVHFTDAGGCWSLVGMQGNGAQTISLGTGCSTGNAIHEIGHAVGLWHEQSREDRDLFVRINWQNIQAGMSAQFNQHITDGDDLGAYDYGSIMHYPRTAFSANGQDTITPLDPNAQIGQRSGLSAGDIAAVRVMYPSCGGIVKRPWAEPGGGRVKKVVDDLRPVKKLRDDPRFKKVRDDNVVVKSLRDPKPPHDPGPIKIGFDPNPIGQPPLGLPGGGTRQPFTLATPHHAAGASALEATLGLDPDSMAYVETLQQQLLEIGAATAEAQAIAARATADAAQLQATQDEIASVYDQAVRDLGGDPAGG